MIRLAKGPKPAVLVEHEAHWTKEYEQYLNGEDVPKAAARRYGHPEIKGAVKAETSDKCVYCEGHGTAFAPGDVEHILPKSLFPALVVAWTNLTFACSECNRRKLDHHSTTTALLNPYEDEPSDHLVFAGPWVLNRPGANRGYSTRRLIGLNRPDLLKRRADLLEQLQTLIDRHALESDADVRAFLFEQLLEYTDPSHEFSAAARAVLEQEGLI